MPCLVYSGIKHIPVLINRLQAVCFEHLGDFMHTPSVGNFKLRSASLLCMASNFSGYPGRHFGYAQMDQTVS